MPDRPVTPIALALGSNLGDSLDAIRKAITALAPYVEVKSISPVYETAPAYVTDQPVFKNTTIIGETKLEPLALLWLLKDIEREIGRTPTYRYGPRVIDLDIIFYGDTILETPELTIPHARMMERNFVLFPLKAIAPDWKHPKNGLTVSEMSALLPETGITCLGPLLS